MLRTMRTMCVMSMCLVTALVFGQSASKYQLATIMAVKPHQTQGGSTEVVSYDVSVKVGDTIYEVLYTPPSGASPIKYAAGRDVLVQVGEKTLRYNNIVGQSLEVPIVSRKPSPEATQTK